MVLRVVEVEIKSFKKAEKETTPLLHSVEEVKSNKEVVEKASIDCVKHWRNSERNFARLFKNEKRTLSKKLRRLIKLRLKQARKLLKRTRRVPQRLLKNEVSQSENTINDYGAESLASKRNDVRNYLVVRDYSVSERLLLLRRKLARLYKKRKSSFRRNDVISSQEPQKSAKLYKRTKRVPRRRLKRRTRSLRRSIKIIRSRIRKYFGNKINKKVEKETIPLLLVKGGKGRDKILQKGGKGRDTLLAKGGRGRDKCTKGGKDATLDCSRRQR